MDNVMEQIVNFATTYGIRVIGAIVILILGRIAAGIARRIVTSLMERAKVEPTVITFVRTLTYMAILAFAVIAALAKFGVQTTSFVAVLACAGFAIGFALQGSLGNAAAGVLILILRPFKAGDYIEAAGVAGTVKEVRLFNTVMTTVDNIKLIVPNGNIYGNVIKNITAYDTRRVDLVIGIAYGSPIGKAIDIVANTIKQDARVLEEPAFQIAVAELADSSVNLVVRPWVKTEDYWVVRFDLTRGIKEAFDQNGIEIPFPQRVVHMAQEN